MPIDAQYIEWAYIIIPLALVALLLATAFALRRAFRMKKVDKFGWGLICFWILVGATAASSIVEKTNLRKNEPKRPARQN